MKYAVLTIALLALVACDSDRPAPLAPDVAAPTLSRESRDDDRRDDEPGVVYTMSNQVAGNAVLAFHRGANGRLVAGGSFATGGTGTGGGLGNQGALAFSRDDRFLFVVNPGSNDVSTFRMKHGDLEFAGKVSSGGMRPISVTSARGLVYVLNGGGTGNIVGFRVNGHGMLTPIANATRPLSSGASGAAQIEFDTEGDRLVVTEKATNIIATYRVDDSGHPDAAVFTPSSGQTPFGFAFRRNVLIVSEALGGAPNASVSSSYRIRSNGTLGVISGSVPTTETAACWIVVTGNGRYAYASNTGSGTITGYSVSPIGRLERLDENGETAVIGAGTGPIDMALSGNSRYLYVLNSGTETIRVLRVHSNGSLTAVDGGIDGLPNGANGLVAK